ncbi:hypothetical protein BDV97DRAFT_393265 [Delphinella strobiligena]|nr:hypothetical protein BDV97DRAFT_393265 [Delphinella strobiligena]
MSRSTDEPFAPSIIASTRKTTGAIKTSKTNHNSKGKIQKAKKRISNATNCTALTTPGIEPRQVCWLLNWGGSDSYTIVDGGFWPVPITHKAALPSRASNVKSSRFANDKQPLEFSKRAARNGDISSKAIRIPASSRATNLENSRYLANTHSSAASTDTNVPTPPPPFSPQIQTSKSMPPPLATRTAYGAGTCLIDDHSHTREYETFAFDKKARCPGFYRHNQVSVLVSLEWDYGNGIRGAEIWRVWMACGVWGVEDMFDEWVV